jgi:hypothetical protein
MPDQVTKQRMEELAAVLERLKVNLWIVQEDHNQHVIPEVEALLGEALAILRPLLESHFSLPKILAHSKKKLWSPGSSS